MISSIVFNMENFSHAPNILAHSTAILGLWLIQHKRTVHQLIHSNVFLTTFVYAEIFSHRHVTFCPKNKDIKSVTSFSKSLLFRILFFCTCYWTMPWTMSVSAILESGLYVWNSFLHFLLNTECKISLISNRYAREP